jgi:2-hydroxy-3-oxopropionate reductase
VASVGFIGVGVMGCEMVRNLRKARHRVRVFDVRPEACEVLRANGAEVAASVADAVHDAEEGHNGNQALFRVYDRLTGQGPTP